MWRHKQILKRTKTSREIISFDNSLGVRTKYIMGNMFRVLVVTKRQFLSLWQNHEKSHWIIFGLTTSTLILTRSSVRTHQKDKRVKQNINNSLHSFGFCAPSYELMRQRYLRGGKSSNKSDLVDYIVNPFATAERKGQQCLLMSERLTCSCDEFSGASEQEAGAHVTWRLADGNLERIRPLFSNL